jgi:hypothetical protein
MEAKRLNRQGETASAAIAIQILLQIKSSRIKEKWFVVMAKPACVVLHMVASNKKDGGRGHSDAYCRVAATVRQDMKNNVAATMAHLLLILVNGCHGCQ